jgi:uncharacterized glyoxalase superfamily protein PhnB
MTQRIVPFIAYEDAPGAIEWLCAAFGAREDEDARQTGADGAVGHAELDFGGATVFLATPTPEYQSPRRHRKTCDAARRWQDNPWVIDGLFVEVDDVDAHHARALDHGAAILREPADQPYGFRVYTAEDVEGHRWMFGERLAT